MTTNDRPPPLVLQQLIQASAQRRRSLDRREAHFFALAALGACLQAGVPGSIRRSLTVIRFSGTSGGNMLHSVETGEAAFQHAFGLTPWDYYAQHPEQAALRT